MKRRKWIGFFAILLVSACLLTIPRAYVVEGEVTDFSQIAPVIKLTEPTYTKAYQSNIPNAFYDASKGFGSQSSDEYSYPSTFIDLISIDGTHNYAKDDFIKVPYNSSVSFYIETAYMGWYYDGSTPIHSNYDITNDNENAGITFEISTYKSTNSAYGVDYTFDSSNPSYVFSDDNLFIDNNGELEFNSSYHMPMMTINGIESGITKITIHVYDDNEYGDKTIDLWVVCGEEEEFEFFNGIKIFTTYGNSEVKDDIPMQTFYLETSDNPYFAIPFEFANNCGFSVNNNLINVSVSTAVDSNDAYAHDSTVSFYYPGEYDIVLTFTTKLETNIQSDGDKQVTLGTRTIHLLVYSQYNIQYYDSDGNLFDPQQSVDLADLPISLVPLTPNFSNYTQFQLSYSVTNTGTQATGDLSIIDSVGSYRTTCTINDTAYEAVMNTYEYGDQSGEEINYPINASFSGAISITVEDLDAQYPTATLSLNTSPLNTQENSLYLSDFYLYTFEIDNFAAIQDLGGTITVSVPGIYMLNAEEAEFTINDLYSGTYEIVTNVYYPSGQMERIATYPVNITGDMSLGIYDVDTEAIITSVTLPVGDEKNLEVRLYQDDQIFGLPSMLSISHMPINGIEVGSEPATGEFYISASEVGEYNLNIIVLEGEYQSYAGAVALEVIVTEAVNLPECYFGDSNRNPVSTLELSQNDSEDLFLYLYDGEDIIQVDNEYNVSFSYSTNNIVNASTSFGGPDNIYYVVTIASTDYIGETTISATITWEDRTFVGQIAVNVSTTDSPSFYFVDETGAEITELSLIAGESAEVGIYYRLAQLDEALPQSYQVSYQVNKSGITVAPIISQDSPNMVNGRFMVDASNDALGDYVVLCSITNESFNETIYLNVSVMTIASLTRYYFADNEGVALSEIELEKEGRADFTIYQTVDGKESLVTDIVPRFSVSNQNALTVFNNPDMQETNGYYSVTAGTIVGSFTILAYLDSNEPITLNVSVLLDSPASEFSYYLYDENDESVSGLVKLPLNGTNNYTVKAYGASGLVELDSHFSLVCDNSEPINYEINGAVITISENEYASLGSLLIKILYDGEIVDSIVFTYQIGDLDIPIPEPEGEFYFENYEYVAMGEKEFYIPIMYRLDNEEAPYAGSDLSVEIMNNYLNNGSIRFDSEHNQLVYNPYSSGYEQVTCIFIYKGFYLSKHTFYLRTVITTQSIETTFAEGAVVQALLTDEYVRLTVPQAYEDMLYQSERFAVAMDRNICLVDSYPEREMIVRLNDIGSTDVYLILQSDGSQIVLKSTIIVSREEPHIDIDVRREGDATGAISKLDNLIFTLNPLGFVFSDDLSYEWIVDDVIASSSATYQTKLSEGSHNVKLRLTDNKQKKTFEAERVMRIAAIAGQQHQLSFAENEIYLVMLKNQYELQVLLDGMIANEYVYQWSTDDDTVSLFNSGSSKATILPNHAGTTTVYAFVDVGVGEEKIISAVVTIIVEKVENIGYRLSQEFPKPGKPFDVIFTVNGRDDCKNADFNCTVLENGTEITPNMSGNTCHFDNPVTAKYQFTYRLGNLEEVATVKVSNFNFREFLITILPFVMVGLVLAVIAYTFIVRGLNPYRNITKAINQMENTFQKEIAKNSANHSVKDSVNAFKKLRHQSHKLLNKINYFSDEGFDGLDIAIKAVLTMQAIFDSLVHESATLSEQDCTGALNKTYEQNFKESKELIAQAIDSQLHYQKQVKENNADDKVKKTKTKKERIDYKKELYRNGVLTAPDSESDSDQ